MDSKHSGDSARFSLEERLAPHKSGMALLVLDSVLILASIAMFIVAVTPLARYWNDVLRLMVIVVSVIYGFFVGPILYFGLKVLKPNEALVLTLFGRYYGTLRGEGFYFVNPFVTGVNPTAKHDQASSNAAEKPAAATAKYGSYTITIPNKKLSLKAMTLNNDKQKINDSLGNPIIIGIVVIWKVVNTAKAVFNVDNYVEYLSIQCDSALRNIVRLYPYDASDDEGEKSLRGSSLEVAERLKEEIQAKMTIAGIEIIEARITHLSYAPEIAAAMLQRQQASAIIAARQMIVEGAVGMVEMALEQLSKKEVVTLDEERKASMVSNLLVVLCGNRDAQPVVNSGSIY
ncbi:MAG: SPFH domain-containing protein [Sphaerochaetaceae bacterium]|jgi:regulator of protease activity HflC (stomatin/prohibitin superfamily)|nr:SPFH domain-containing protein [Sphaerochaetaceae bacterium]MDD3941293.1 SPFH domain-containing protein [Sphaerochaetaceae bacterium]MDX9938884.1 SPFH domain-containing protein [Sphaerochaetaceae bacterium]